MQIVQAKQLTFRVIKGRQRDGPLQAQRLAVPVKSAEHIKKLLQHLQLPQSFCSVATQLECSRSALARSTASAEALHLEGNMCMQR